MWYDVESNKNPSQIPNTTASLVPGVALCLVDDPADRLAHCVRPALLLQGVPAHRDPLLTHLTQTRFERLS